MKQQKNGRHRSQCFTAKLTAPPALSRNYHKNFTCNSRGGFLLRVLGGSDRGILRQAAKFPAALDS
jgi:hypothetical protein